MLPAWSIRCIGFVAIAFAGCARPAAPPAPHESIEAAATSSRPVETAEPPHEDVRAEAGVAPLPLPRRWALATSATEGAVVVRCDARPGREEQPDCASCEPFAPCVDPASEPVLDGPRCRFACKPIAGTKTYRLRCPDGTKPQSDVRGCFCGPVRILRVCGNNEPTRAVIAGDVCSITCP